MTNYEFLKSEASNLHDMARLFSAGCNCCIFNGKFESCHNAGVKCDTGNILWLQAKHEEKGGRAK